MRRQEIASFLTSSMVGSRCVLYLARGCHLSYCAWRFFPAQQKGLSIRLLFIACDPGKLEDSRAVYDMLMAFCCCSSC